MYDVMLDEYYEERGWDSEGRPRPEKLKKMKIDQLM
jgi:aldehyde:ferredoxin oxidoreductase